jgi:hypothetical protein
MRAQEASALVNIGAEAKVRQYLKRLSLKERLPLLHDLIPYIEGNPKNIKFFRDNFSQEIGSLIAASYDYEKAEKIYNGAKLLK